MLEGTGSSSSQSSFTGLTWLCRPVIPAVRHCFCNWRALVCSDASYKEAPPHTSEPLPILKHFDLTGHPNHTKQQSRGGQQIYTVAQKHSCFSSVPFLQILKLHQLFRHDCCHVTSTVLSRDRLWWQLFLLKGHGQLRDHFLMCEARTAFHYVYSLICSCRLPPVLRWLLVPELEELTTKARKSWGNMTLSELLSFKYRGTSVQVTTRNFDSLVTINSI